MANRVKEDEKNERIIRNLLKLADNRRCINCNSLGPQYVCTNFWTFVCTTCSGVHREFTHRVKSVSMAKFTTQEVSALQGGGNAHAKEIYLKEWDSQRHSVPDTSNAERLRDFIKHVYVDRRYTGERSFDKPPRVKMGEAEDSYEGRRIDTYQGGRSPPYEDTYERRYSDRPSPGGRSDDRNYRNSYGERSPGYDQESRRYGDFKRSPARAEIINDWRREERFGNGRRSEDGRISDGSSKMEGRSPDYQKDLNISSPPMVRPVRDILGENVSPLRVIEPPKANGGGVTDGSRTQRTASSSSLASSNGNPAELKRENSGILIDFDAVPEPPTSAIPQTQQTAMGQSVVQPATSSSSDNWACFDSAPEVKISQAPANANSLESVLSQLTVPASVPVQTAGFPGANTSALPSSHNSLGAPAGHMSISLFGDNAPAAVLVDNLTNFPPVNTPVAAPVGHVSMFPLGVGAPVAATANKSTTFSSGLPSNGANSFVKVADGGQWPNMLPHQPSLFPATGSQPTAQPFTPPVSGSSNNQPWNLSIASNPQGPSSIPSAQTSQALSKPAPDVTSQSSSMEVKPSGRTELPQNLFAATYPSSVPVPGWQTGPPQGYGFNMQYNNTAMPMSTFPHSSKSTNPFDLNNELSPVQAPMFPSMASLHGALPNVAAPAGLLSTSSLGSPSTSWMPSQSSYPSAMPAQVMADSAVKMVKAGCQYITVLGVDFMSENVRAILYQAGFLEIGGESLRIYKCEIQENVLEIVGISPEQAEAKFGYLLEALDMGAPSHDQPPLLIVSSSLSTIMGVPAESRRRSQGRRELRLTAEIMDAGDLRRRTVKRFMEDLGSVVSGEERNAIDDAIRHVVQEVKLLAKKEDREGLDSSINELLLLGMQSNQTGSGACI